MAATITYRFLRNRVGTYEGVPPLTVPDDGTAQLELLRFVGEYLNDADFAALTLAGHSDDTSARAVEIVDGHGNRIGTVAYVIVTRNPTGAAA